MSKVSISYIHNEMKLSDVYFCFIQINLCDGLMFYCLNITVPLISIEIMWFCNITLEKMLLQFSPKLKCCDYLMICFISL